MLKSKWATVGLAATAVAVLVTLPSVSYAQRGGRGGYGGGRGGWDGRGYDGYGRGGIGISIGDPYYGGYYGRGYDNRWGYANNNYAAEPVTGYSSYYQPPASYYSTTQQNSTQSAMLRIQVPANAELFIEGSPTQQQGTQREFVSPPLDPSKNYTYNLRLTFKDAGGQTVERTRKVNVHAGERLDVNMLADATAPNQPIQAGTRTSQYGPGEQPAPAQPAQAQPAAPAASDQAQPTTNLPNKNQAVDPPATPRP